MVYYDDRCRACMRFFPKGSPRVDLLDSQSQLANEFTECCGMLDGDHPRYLCASCSDQTTAFYQFKQMCVKSRKMFEERLGLKMTPQSGEEDGNCSELHDESLHGTPSLPCSDEMADTSCDATDAAADQNNMVASADHDLELRSNSALMDTSTRDASLEISELPSMDDDVVSLTKHFDYVETNAPLTDTITQQAATQVIRLQVPADLMVIRQALNTKRTETFPCTICPKVCITKHSFEGHMRVHQGLEPYACDRPGCNRTFKVYVTLQNHLDLHDGIKFPCKVEGCDRIYAKSSALGRHMRNVHWEDAPPPGHVCEVCGKKLATITSLNTHRYTHRDKSEWPLTCDHPNCNRRFVFEWQLKAHRKQHAGHFQCPHCNARKETKGMLKYHMNLHTKEIKYPCSACTKIFYSSSQMKTHFWKVHRKDMSFWCRFCSCRYTTESKRNAHEKTHDGPQEPPKLHECLVCNQTYKEARSLRKHMQKKHSEATTLEHTPHREYSMDEMPLLNEIVENVANCL